MHSSLQLALEEREGLIDLTRKRNAKSTKNWSASSSRIVTGIAVSVVGLLLVFGVVLLIWRTKSPHMRYRAFTDDKSVPIGKPSLLNTFVKDKEPVVILSMLVGST